MGDLTNPLVSIIIPVYNAESYLCECLDSVLSQTYRNIEVILINDGSTDNSLKLCQKYALGDSRIILVSQENKGNAVARNRGIKIANGEYLFFIDADDFVKPNFVEVLLQACIQNNVLLSMCDVYMYYGMTSISSLCDVQTVAREYLNPSKYNFEMHVLPVRKCYHKSLLEEISFPEGIYHEDIGFWYGVMSIVSEISVAAIPLYYYRKNNPNSITVVKISREKRSLDIVKSFVFGLELSEKYGLPDRKPEIVVAMMYPYSSYYIQKSHKNIYHYKILNMICKYKKFLTKNDIKVLQLIKYPNYAKLQKHLKNFISLWEIIPQLVIEPVAILRYLLLMINDVCKCQFEQKSVQKDESKDISVIVQGAVNKKETPKCLKSIRKYLPGAEIILSTWEETDVSGLDYDILVLNKDPGNTLIYEINGRKVFNNINRQLFSTQEGLKKATRKYALKFRSDLILTGDKFIDYFDKFQDRSSNYNLFERKIITSCLISRYEADKGLSDSKNKFPFHPSDWWFFGLTDDLKKYFLDTPLVEEPYFTQYFSMDKHKLKQNPYGIVKFRFSPEQYYCYSCFARNFSDIYMEDAADYSEELMDKSRECIINNFIILEFPQSGIYMNKYYYSKHESNLGEPYLTLYNFHRYETEYKKFCNPDYQITTSGKLFENNEVNCARLRLQKHIFKLTDKSSSFSFRLEQLFIGIPISFVNYMFKLCKNKFINR